MACIRFEKVNVLVFRICEDSSLAILKACRPECTDGSPKCLSEKDYRQCILTVGVCNCVI